LQIASKTNFDLEIFKTFQILQPLIVIILTINPINVNKTATEKPR